MLTREYYDKYWLRLLNGRSPRPDPPPTPGQVSERQASISPALRDLLQPYITPSARYLDVGCGDGHACGLWLREHGGHYTGVDVSSIAIEQARALGLDAQLIDDASTLPFAANSFDVAVCSEAFEHMFSPHLAAAEILRVLRPGGTLVATVPNIVYWKCRLNAVVGRWDPRGVLHSARQPWQDPHIRFFTEAAFKWMLLGAGYDHVGMSGLEGAFVKDLPYIRRLSRTQRAGPLYRRLEAARPSIFALRLSAVARKPA